MKILKYEISSYLKNSNFLDFCTIMIVFSFLITCIPFYGMDEIYLEYHGKFQLFPFITNAENRTFFSFFIVLLPLFCTYSTSQVLIKQRKSMMYIYSRCKRNTFLYSELFISFLAGFILIVISLLGCLLFSAIILYAKEQSIYNIVTMISPNNEHNLKLCLPFYNLYLSNPLLLALMYTLLIGVFGGLLCSATVIISYLIKNKLVIYLGMFVVVFIAGLITFIFPWIGFALNPLSVTKFGNEIVIGIWYVGLVLFILCGSIFILKKDVI